MSGHTPGPWKAREINPKDSAWGACEIWPKSGGRPVATMVCGTANARLMAAAPELLDALTVAREWMRGDKWRNSTVEKHASWEAVMRGIDAAIAKATGAHA